MASRTPASNGTASADIPARLRRALAGAHAPAPGEVDAEGARPAAVLLPILLGPGAEPRLVFTRRTDTLSRHAGEISFPGGLADPDEDLAATALREAEEELGLLPSDVELIGALPAVHTHVSGILIAPFVGLLHTDPRFTPNEAEISEVLEFTLADLVDAGTERWFEWEGSRFLTHVFDMDGAVIWGATARILRSFLDAMAEPGGADEPA